jgi:hypothetical protein
LQVRTMMGCSSMTGAPLEDEGGSGTATNHWEYRLFQVGPGRGAGCPAALIATWRHRLCAGRHGSTAMRCDY